MRQRRPDAGYSEAPARTNFSPNWGGDRLQNVQELCVKDQITPLPHLVVLIIDWPGYEE